MNYLNLMLQDTLIVTKHVQKAAIIDIPTATVKATSIGIKVSHNSFISHCLFGMVKRIKFTNFINIL